MSAPEISIELTPSSQARLAGFKTLPARVKNAIARAIDQQNLVTVSHTQQARMTGVGPFPPEEGRLGRRSSRLAISLRATKAKISGDAITSAIGSNVKYARIHEFGGTIQRTVKAGSVRLRTDREGNLLRQGKNGKLAIFARATHKRAKTVSFAGGKSYEIEMPERAPVRQGIADCLGNYREALSDAIIAATEGKS